MLAGYVTGSISTFYNKCHGHYSTHYAQVVPIVHLEDVYMTGLCAHACNIRRTSHPGFKARVGSASEPLRPQDIVIHYAGCNDMQRLHQQARLLLTGETD